MVGIRAFTAICIKFFINVEEERNYVLKSFNLMDGVRSPPQSFSSINYCEKSEIIPFLQANKLA